MSKFAKIIEGAALIAGAVAGVFFGLPPNIAIMMIQAGASLVISGIGTLLNHAQTGLSTSSRNPIAPWNVVYGRAKIGGNILYIGEFGEVNKYLDMVIVLACHPCQSVDALLFDNQRVLIEPTTKTSFSPTQATVNIASIIRTNDVVTVVLNGTINGLLDGDLLAIENVPGDETLNGRYAITVITLGTSFSYICGGAPATVLNAGQVRTTWPDYRDKVYMEALLGDHTQTFDGMLNGTPDDGDLDNLVFPPANPFLPPNNPWTADHLALGKTVVFLRLHYNDKVFSSGLPQISFLLHGKKDIYDPRRGTRQYTENAALCIADYLADTTWGFKATYGTEIPLDPLISAANICDEAVPLASGAVESRYALNGTFPLTIKRGEVLQNLLTACGGRLTYVGGQFVIHPAAWLGPSSSIGPPLTAGTVTVWGTFTNLTSAPATPEVAAFAGAPVPNLGLLDTGPRITSIAQDQLFDIDASGASAALTSFSHTLSPTELAQLNVLTLGCFIQGTLFAADNLATFRVYDVYADVTYPDTTTARIRPRNAEYVPQGPASHGFVLDPDNARDADSSPPSSFAEITRTEYNGIANAGYLLLSNFPYQRETGGGGSGGDGSPVSMTALAVTAGPFQWKPKRSGRDLYNGVKGVYISPSNNWQSSDIPPYAQDATHGYASGSPMYPLGDANLAADGGERRWREIQLPFTISATTAQRLEKIELLRLRQQGSGTFVFNLALYKVTVLDVLSVTLAFLEWSGKLLEITAHRFTVNKQSDSGNDVTLLGTELDLNETDPSIYDWDPSEELTPQGFQQSPLPDPKIVAPPTNVIVTSDATTAGGAVGGNQDSRLLITWDPPADGYVLNGGHVEVQYQIATSPASSAWVALGTFDPSVTSAYIGGVADGTAYNVRIRSVNAAGVPSDWIVVGPVIADGSRSGDRWKEESPVGARDGANPVFTLTFMPDPPESLRLSYAGVDQLQGVDYSLTSEESSPVTSPVSNVGTITFLRSEHLPDEAAGEWLWAQYRY